MAKIATVEGMLESPAVIGGKKSPVLVLHLAPWTDGTTAHVQDKLRVEIPFRSERTCLRAMRACAQGALVRIATGPIAGAPNAPSTTGVWPLKSIRGTALLRAAIVEHNKPVVVRHEGIGRMTLDRAMNWFEGKVSVWGHRRRLSVNVASDPGEAFDAAVETLAWIERDRAAIEAALVTKLLPLYNDNWREARPTITAEKLLKRLPVQSVGLEADGDGTLYLGAGTLFYGHGIDVRIRARKVSEVLLAG